jgi:hypothetical protein
MEALTQELATLDAVNQDVWRTQASIRRDTANVVLQTAFAMKECKPAASTPAELRDRLEPASDANVSDLWAKKLLRWADQFGRDLFGIGGTRAPNAKKNRATLPAPKP